MEGELRDSLLRRIAGMHQLWQMAVSDMTLGHVNHRERPGVVPIAFSLYHYVYSEDRTASGLLLGELPLWERDAWTERVGVRPSGAASRGIPMEQAEKITLGDLGAWREYQTATFARTETALGGLRLRRLEDELFGGVIPESLVGAFVTMVVGSRGPIRVVDAIECFIYQHGIRHMGELEHARALVGLRGMT